RSLGTLSFLAAQGGMKTQPWQAIPGKIIVPSGTVQAGSTISLQVPGMDLSGARIVWEARGQEPCFGPTLTLAPTASGAIWVEAEAQWPDGRRVFASTNFNASSPNTVWVDDSLPAGANA